MEWGGMGLTPWLTGAGSRRLEGTNIGHENAEGMAYVGVRVEPTVRLGREVEGGGQYQALDGILEKCHGDEQRGGNPNPLPARFTFEPRR